MPVEVEDDGTVIGVPRTVVPDREFATSGIRQRHSDVSGVLRGHDTDQRAPEVRHDVILHSQGIHLGIQQNSHQRRI